MSKEIDTTVIGLGAMGAAALYQLAIFSPTTRLKVDINYLLQLLEKPFKL